MDETYWRRKGLSHAQQMTRVIHRHQFYACHPPNLFLRGALKSWITPHFSLPSIPNLCVFYPFLLTLIPGCSVSPCLTDTYLGIRPAVWQTLPEAVEGHHPPGAAPDPWGRVRGCCGQELGRAGKAGCTAQSCLENLALLPGEARAEFVRVSTSQRQGGGGKRR